MRVPELFEIINDNVEVASAVFDSPARGKRRLLEVERRRLLRKREALLDEVRVRELVDEINDLRNEIDQLERQQKSLFRTTHVGAQSVRDFAVVVNGESMTAEIRDCHGIASCYGV